MTHQNQATPAAAPAQIRVTVETLDHKGRVQRKLSLAHDFPAWAQDRAIARCLGATSVTAGALLTRVLPVLQVGTGAEVAVLDPLDYSAITHGQLTAEDKVQRIFTSPLGIEFSQRAAELGISSLNVDEDIPEAYLELIAETFTTWKALVRASDSASRSSGR
jgi:hypothetical protein